MARRSDYDSAWKDALEANAAHLERQRLSRKTELVRGLYLWGYARDDVIQLFRIIDAMLALPEALEPVFEDAVIQIEEDMQMAYVTSIERRAMAKGLEQGVAKGVHKGQIKGAAEVLQALLMRKFGVLPGWVDSRMGDADDVTLKQWAMRVLDARSIEDVFL